MQHIVNGLQSIDGGLVRLLFHCRARFLQSILRIGHGGSKLGRERAAGSGRGQARPGNGQQTRQIGAEKIGVAARGGLVVGGALRGVIGGITSLDGERQGQAIVALGNRRLVLVEGRLRADEIGGRVLGRARLASGRDGAFGLVAFFVGRRRATGDEQQHSGDRRKQRARHAPRV